MTDWLASNLETVRRREELNEHKRLLSLGLTDEQARAAAAPMGRPERDRPREARWGARG